MENNLIKTNNFTALVVDDNPVNLLMAAKMLEATGAETDTASSGEEAIEKVKQKNYDIVFLDYIMPDMDGIETAKALKSIRRERLCIISLSVNNDEKSVKMFKEAGMQDYLPKPIVPEELNKILLKWLPLEKTQKKGNAWLDAVKCIEDINSKRVLEQNGGNTEEYKNALDLFIRNVPNIIKILPSKLEESKKFAAAVRNAGHICINAGADNIAKEADALEAAALAEDMGFCADNVLIFISNLRKLREALNIALNI